MCCILYVYILVNFIIYDIYIYIHMVTWFFVRPREYTSSIQNLDSSHKSLDLNGGSLLSFLGIMLRNSIISCNGQITIVPKPEFFGHFGGKNSLPKPPI